MAARQHSDLATLSIPVDSSSRLSSSTTASQFVGQYYDNDDLSEGVTSARAHSPSSASSDYGQESRLKRRSLSMRSAYHEGEGRPTILQTSNKRHRANASTSSSADLASRWPDDYPATTQHSRHLSSADLYQGDAFLDVDITSGPNASSFGDSNLSLVSSDAGDMAEDASDSAHLTSNMAFHASSSSNAQYPPSRHSTDLRNRRTTFRQSHDGQAATSLSRKPSLLQSAARSLRKTSVRVVNINGQTPTHAGRVRLNDDVVIHRNSDDKEAQPKPRVNSGKTLGLFDEKNPVRRLARACLLYRGTEPAILILIIAYVVILSIQAAPSVFSHPRPTGPGYFRSWEDFVLFGLMTCFTLEAAVRIIVSGLLKGPEDPASVMTDSLPSPPISARLRNRLSYNALSDQFAKLGHPTTPRYRDINKQYSNSKEASASTTHSTSAMLHKRAASAATNLLHDTPFRLAVERQRAATADDTAYLRHSWNRIDLLAITCFWISFSLAMFGVESSKQLYIFRALSVLRAVRLLTFTSGTATILQSLKRAGPLLVNVAFFVVFAMALFSIIGIQSFKGSFRRQCVWMDPEAIANMTTGQVCGGSYATNGSKMGYYAEDSLLPYSVPPKGYLCPVGQLCIEGDNPFNGTASFDNIAAAALQVVVIISNNNWTPPMYQMMDADYFVSCLFFIVCLLILNFWLINLFVAVITNTFASIMDETKHSAFASSAPQAVLDNTDDAVATKRKDVWQGRIRTAYHRTRYVWVALVLASVSVQASQHNGDSERASNIRKQIERYFTLAFDVELLIRFVTYLPDWASFFKSGRNATDSVLVLATSIIQLPFIRNSKAYAWFTAFQLARFYRVMLAIPRIRRLLVKLTGSISGLINMTFFLVLMTFIASLIATQLFRGVIPSEIDDDSIEMSFYQIYNGFLAIYQVLSSEGWVDVLYAATGSSIGKFQVVIAALFIAAWFMFANFILVQMFIAVINEGFEVAEEEKQKQQLERFVKRSKAQSPTPTWMEKLNPYNHVKARAVDVNTGVLASTLTLPMRKDEYISSETQSIFKQPLFSKAKSSPSVRTRKSARSLLHLRTGSSTNLLDSKDLDDDVSVEEDLDRHLALLANRKDTQTEQETALEEKRARLVAFIMAHPSYDHSFWLFTQRNTFRRFCQSCVEPGNGQERIFGAQPKRRFVFLFNLIVFLTIVGSLAIAGVATPLYRQEYFKSNGDIRFTWFNITEVSLGFVFIVEFLVKIIADGFLLTPDAYLGSIWNGLDFMVLLTLVVNVVTALVSGGGVNRLTRAFKAFRALRLINLSKRMRRTFYDVLIIGASKLFDASILAILYIVPYAVWGQNLFSGLLYYCNDGLASNKTECVGEYLASPQGFSFLAPRVWRNPYVWSFDSFRSAFLILFELISLEGWIATLTSAMAITGRDQQPSQDASQYNGIFFLVYNLIGGLLVLSLFVSIIIENFTSRSGMALLTTEQRQWIDLRKLILRQRPSRRPKFRPAGKVRSWCFDRAVQKHGWWSRSMTGLYILHVAILMTQTFENSQTIVRIRDGGFLLLTLMFALDIIVRLAGIGWHSFRQNWWNLYDGITVAGTFITTVQVVAVESENGHSVQYQKLFLVSIAFKLVQKSNALNQLFKNAVASLPAILNLLGLWLILFLVWAIAYIEIFSLTRWRSSETHNMNYSTFIKTMVMLVLTSNGEGWNQIMHDYTVETPFCSENRNFLFSDCGSAPWSFVLYITWCILSMHIFVNMFTGVVVENFSYVFQLYGRVTSIDREEMRSFKKAWADIDVHRSGYLRRRQIGPFLARLTGVFDVRIFPPEARISALVKSTQLKSERDKLRASRNLGKVDVQSGIDLEALNSRLDKIDFHDIARRKLLYTHLYHEIMVTEQPGKGIAFTDMLIVLAHYKLMEDNHALQIQELLQRNIKLRKVNDLISLDKVRGLLATVHYRRAFLAWREEKHRSQNNVPQIHIAGTEDSPRIPSPLPSPLNTDIFDEPPSPSSAFRRSRSASPSSDNRSRHNSAVTIGSVESRLDRYEPTTHV